jgi:hypothetical protein
LQGQITFGGSSLHDISDDKVNPYQEVGNRITNYFVHVFDYIMIKMLNICHCSEKGEIYPTGILQICNFWLKPAPK